MYDDYQDFFPPPPSKEIIWSPGASRETLSEDDINGILAAIQPDDEVTKCLADEMPAAAPSGDEAAEDGTYRFPDITSRMEPHQAKTSKELLITIGQLSHERRDAAGNRCPYLEVRGELCAISILLNERGDYAPRMRSMRIPESRKNSRTTYPADEHALSNDRQVIDLHWLYRKQVPVIDTPGYGGHAEFRISIRLASRIQLCESCRYHGEESQPAWADRIRATAVGGHSKQIGQRPVESHSRWSAKATRSDTHIGQHPKVATER